MIYKRQITFKPGDRVMLICDGYMPLPTGEVTLVRADGWPKILFDGDFDFNYDYYNPDELALENDDEP